MVDRERPEVISRKRLRSACQQESLRRLLVSQPATKQTQLGAYPSYFEVYTTHHQQENDNSLVHDAFPLIVATHHHAEPRE